MVVCDATLSSRGATWGKDGDIVAALGVASLLSRVSAGGGTPQLITKPQAGIATRRWPQFLPRSNAVLFTTSSSSSAVFADAAVEAVSLKTAEIKILIRNGYFGRYLPTAGPTGHLMYVRDSVLYADHSTQQHSRFVGTPVAMIEDLAADPLFWIWRLQFFA